MNSFPAYLKEIVDFQGKSIRSSKQFSFLSYKLNAAMKAHRTAGLGIDSIKFQMEPCTRMINFKFSDCWVAVTADSLNHRFYVSIHQGNPDEIVGK